MCGDHKLIDKSKNKLMAGNRLMFNSEMFLHASLCNWQQYVHEQRVQLIDKKFTDKRRRVFPA